MSQNMIDAPTFVAMMTGRGEFAKMAESDEQGR